MGILETLIVVFLGLFLVGLILSITIWLMWLFLVLAFILFVIRLVRGIVKKVSAKKNSSV